YVLRLRLATQDAKHAGVSLENGTKADGGLPRLRDARARGRYRRARPAARRRLLPVLERSGDPGGARGLRRRDRQQGATVGRRDRERRPPSPDRTRSEEHTSELQSRENLVC